MTIPKNIKREHIIQAMQKIEGEEVPERRKSTRFNLCYEGKYYPPKYVISIANIFANGEEYPPTNFSGGDETNRFLNNIGFIIVENNSNEIEDEKGEIDFKLEVPAIRLLPMSEDDPEFTAKTIADLQEWFVNELPFRKYNFKKGMKADSGTLVLFQYKKHVIASAILEEKILYENEGKFEGGYRGAYYFNPSSIAIFTPINSEEIKNIWAHFKGFNQSLQKLNVKQCELFYRLLLSKNIRYVLDEGTEDKRILIRVPPLEPVSRSREYDLYYDAIKDIVVYESLFNSKTHRWLDEHVIGLNSDESRGYQAMGILHYIGLKDKHKGIFDNLSINEAIKLLEHQVTDFSLVIQSLQRYEQKENRELDIEDRSSTDVYIEVESIVKAAPEQIEITETEKERVIKSRIGQSTFKKSLINIEKKCSLCSVTDERFLIASHIKPWSQSNNRERLDANNGLLLCPNHDTLFDKGYISFDEDGVILVSSSLDKRTKIFLNINENIKIKMNNNQQDYMKWHRDNLYSEFKQLSTKGERYGS
ncbi:HNH endonuclease signature motif containing protein [Aciduricibacillus chroicocephali]|uniref:HNH endonuclease signature motif containing protein n=1 Tax=Aciduricibacillus chroicocephali TaxID=3054939 RepID=A0ABY9KYP1_9BACI|nr:HNH endonuclease signature motif containing protein [Bacillaceae bacterium 44XB]